MRGALNNGKTLSKTEKKPRFYRQSFFFFLLYFSKKIIPTISRGNTWGKNITEIMMRDAKKMKKKKQSPWEHFRKTKKNEFSTIFQSRHSYRYHALSRHTNQASVCTSIYVLRLEIADFINVLWIEFTIIRLFKLTHIILPASAWENEYWCWFRSILTHRKFDAPTNYFHPLSIIRSYNEKAW